MDPLAPVQPVPPQPPIAQAGVQPSQNMPAKKNGVGKIIIMVVVLGIVIYISIVGIRLFLVGSAVKTGLDAAARDAQRRNDVQNIAKAIEEHYDVKGGTYLAPQASWFADGKIPKDPNGKTYQGIPDGPITQFKICATLENVTHSSSSNEYCMESQR